MKKSTLFSLLDLFVLIPATLLLGTKLTGNDGFCLQLNDQLIGGAYGHQHIALILAAGLGSGRELHMLPPQIRATPVLRAASATAAATALPTRGSKAAGMM